MYVYVCARKPATQTLMAKIFKFFTAGVKALSTPARKEDEQPRGRWTYKSSVVLVLVLVLVLSRSSRRVKNVLKSVTAQWWPREDFLLDT